MDVSYSLREEWPVPASDGARRIRLGTKERLEVLTGSAGVYSILAVARSHVGRGA